MSFTKTIERRPPAHATSLGWGGRRLLASVVACAFAALASAHALAADTTACAGVEVPASIVDEGVVLRLNGVGLRRVGWSGLGIDVYVAALYLEHTERDADRLLQDPPRLRLALHFVRAVDRARLIEGFDEAFEEAIPTQPALAPKKDRLNAWMRDAPAGSVLAFTHRPARGLAIQLDAEPLGEIPGEDFARVLLAHWLEEDGVQASLARALFGGPCRG